MLSLGHDEWANESRMALRAGLRQLNMIDYGGLTVGRVETNVILGDGGWCEFGIPCASEAAAVLEFQRITTGIDRGCTIAELLPDVELPDEILNAWIN